MSQTITTAKELEACVGKTPGPRDLKVIDHLDEHARRWISESRCAFVALADIKSDSISATVAGGEPGFVGADSTCLRIPLAQLDHTDQIKKGVGLGSLLLVPTLKESLRVNGVVESVDDNQVVVRVQECYLHCAKAFMRSAFWQAEPSTETIAHVDAFLRATNFILVASADSDGDADMSPKGDPAGKLLAQRDNSVWYPERPGNRRVDGYRNMLVQPKLEVLALVPGHAQLLRISGRARLSTDREKRRLFEVKNKLPTLVNEICSPNLALEHSPALECAALWSSAPPRSELNAATIFKAHMKLSKVKGVQAKIAKTAISVPGAIEKGLEFDYDKNMY